MKFPAKLKHQLLYPAIVIFLAVAILPSMYFYFQAEKAKQEASSDKLTSGDKELEQILEKMDKLVLLPQGEKPTLGTVVDKAQLLKQSPEFYKNSENGDKVLIYAAARKAYLYRPSINKVVEIAPVNPSQSTATSSAN